MVLLRAWGTDMKEQKVAKSFLENVVEMGNHLVMKKLAFFAVLTIAVYAVPTAPVYADASENGCEHSDGKAKGCGDTTTVPEPNIGVLVATGLLAAAGLAFMINRKRMAQN